MTIFHTLIKATCGTHFPPCWRTSGINSIKAGNRHCIWSSWGATWQHLYLSQPFWCLDPAFWRPWCLRPMPMLWPTSTPASFCLCHQRLKSFWSSEELLPSFATFSAAWFWRATTDAPTPGETLGERGTSSVSTAAAPRLADCASKRTQSLGRSLFGKRWGMSHLSCYLISLRKKQSLKWKYLWWGEGFCASQRGKRRRHKV